MQQVHINEPSRRTPLFGEYEVVVLGGGPAGIAAALAAGRRGRSTLLIERYGFLGGAGTAAGLSTFCGLHAVVHGKHEQVVHGIADDILDRLAAMDGLNKPHLTVQNKIQAQAYDISAFKIAADELIAEAKVKVLYHAFAAGVVMAADDRIDALLVETKSGRFAVRGQIFIDGSGDGDLAAWAGAPYEVGDGVGNMLYPSTMFRINGVDPDKAGRAWELIPTLMEEAEKVGPYVPAQEADRSAAAQSDRMARKPHADQESGRHGCQRHRCRTTELRRGRRTPAMLGRVPVHPQRDAGF